MTETHLSALEGHPLLELFEQTQAIVFVKDRRGRYQYVNRRLCEFLGAAPSAILGRRDRELVDDLQLIETIEESDRRALAPGERVSVQRRSAVRAGKLHHFLVTKVPLPAPDGTVMAVCAILTELDERRARGLDGHPPFYDLLTDLPSKPVFMKRVDQVLSGLQDENACGALLLLDLDKFRLINDARGYECGDRILQEVAHRLTAGTFARDTVCRVGGDEFAILLTALGRDPGLRTYNAARTAEKLKLILTQTPFDVAGVLSALTVSIGVVLLTGGLCSANQALHDAELATHRAKALGGNRVVFHERKMQRAVQRRLDLEQGLRAALDARQLQMVVQPQGVLNGPWSGAELLSRWHHPVHGSVPPDVFIPLAERTGLIHRITDWSLGVACDLSRKLNEQGRALPVSVNISPVCLMARDFVSRVLLILERSGASGADLVFEITEGIWLQDAVATERRIKELARLGVHFSVDDFGTGYSNLSYLKDLSLYEIKIDKRLVRDLPGNADSCTITELALTMAQRLGLRTTAEGVETPAQARFLLDHGCDALQGYLLARPMPIEALLAYESSSLPQRN